MGDHGRDIPGQPQVRRLGADRQFLLDAGLRADQIVRHRVGGRRHTHRVLGVRRVLRVRALVRRLSVAADRGQEPPGDPGHAARPDQVREPQDDDPDAVNPRRRPRSTADPYKSD